MGQCAGGTSRSPSALQLCQAYEQQITDDLAQGISAHSAARRGQDPRQLEANASIWHHLARDEVRAVGEIVSAWANRQIDGTAARRQIQVRVLRGHSSATAGLQSSLTATLGAAMAPGIGRNLGGQGALRLRPAEDAPREEAERGNERGSSSRGGVPVPSDPLGGGVFEGGLLSSLAAALAGGMQPRAEIMPPHEVFDFVDSIFLCRAFEDARVMAMNELNLEGNRALPSEVRDSFHRKAKAILTGQRPTGLSGPWLDLVRLCLCAELVRHLKASRGGTVQPNPLAYTPLRPDLAAFGMPQPHPLLGVGQQLARLDMQARPGVDIIFVTGLPHDGGGGVSGITFARANIGIEGLPGGPFRMDPDFLRERVGFLLEAVLGGADGHVPRNNGLTQEEIERSCPVRPRGPTDGGCCPVCLEPEVEGEEVRKLPCGHELHKECLEAWLATADTCPTCRHQIQRG